MTCTPFPGFSHRHRHDPAQPQRLAESQGRSAVDLPEVAADGGGARIAFLSDTWVAAAAYDHQLLQPTKKTTNS